MPENTTENEVLQRTQDGSFDDDAPETSYELRVSRRPSTDYLEELQGALLMAQVESVVNELAGPECPITSLSRIVGDEVFLIVAAPDPVFLQELTDTILFRYGHELPDVQEMPPGAIQPPLFATQNAYSAHSVYGVSGELIVESTARALLSEARDKDSDGEDRTATTFQAEALAYRRFAQRLGVDPPATTSIELQAARALLDAIPQGAFLGVPITGAEAPAVLALLQERGLITSDERRRATAALA